MSYFRGAEAAAVDSDLTAYAAALDGYLDAGSDALAAASAPLVTTDAQMAAMRALMGDLYAAGWNRYGWDENAGGLGGSVLHRAVMWEALARHRVQGMAAFEHLEVLGPTLIAMGRPDFVSEVFPHFLDGTQTWAQGFSEPDAGSDLASLRTRATPVERGFTISGRKIWTSWAAYARWSLVLARTGTPDSRHRGITAFVVDLQSPEVEVRRIKQANGHEELAEVTFDGVFVPEDRLLGTLDGGWAVAMHILGHERGTFAWFRQTFLNQVLAEHVQDSPAEADALLGDAILDLASVRAMSIAALGTAQAGIPLGARSGFTKLALCAAEKRLYDWVLAACPDLAVDPGDDELTDLRARYLFSRIVTIYGGSQQMQLDTVAKQILRLPA